MMHLGRKELTANESGIIFCIVMGVTLLLQVILGSVLGDQSFQWAYSFLAPILTILCIVGACLYKRVSPLDALGCKRAPKPLWALLSALLAISAIVAFLPLATGVQYLLELMGYHQTPSYADYTSDWGPYILGLVALAILPALGEEALYRGTLYRSMRSQGTIYAMLISATIFGLMHGSPVQLVHQWLIGLIMAYLVHMTGSLWCSIIMHCLNNAVVITYEFAMVQTNTVWLVPWWGYLIMAAVGIGLVVGLLCAVAKVCRVQGEEAQLTYANVPTVLCGQDAYYARSRQRMSVGTIVALVLVAVLWLINTIVGWIQ